MLALALLMTAAHPPTDVSVAEFIGTLLGAIAVCIVVNVIQLLREVGQR